MFSVSFKQFFFLPKSLISENILSFLYYVLCLTICCQRSQPRAALINKLRHNFIISWRWPSPRLAKTKLGRILILRTATPRFRSFPMPTLWHPKIKIYVPRPSKFRLLRFNFDENQKSRQARNVHFSLAARTATITNNFLTKIGVWKASFLRFALQISWIGCGMLRIRFYFWTALGKLPPYVGPIFWFDCLHLHVRFLWNVGLFFFGKSVAARDRWKKFDDSCRRGRAENTDNPI